MWELNWLLGQGETFPSDPAEAHRCVLEVVRQWDLPWLYYFIQNTNIEDIIVHPLMDLNPRGLDVDTLSPGIAFIGDSIHPMSPYKGRGANEAIVDSDSFVQSLIKHQGNIDKAFKEYHHEMIPRSSVAVERSHDATLFYHSSATLNKCELYKFNHW